MDFENALDAKMRLQQKGTIIIDLKISLKSYISVSSLSFIYECYANIFALIY